MDNIEPGVDRPFSAVEGAVPSGSKREIGRSFSEAAAGYDRLASLQRQVGEVLLSRLGEAPAQPFENVIDLGAGTGFCTERLRHRLPASKIFALDIAPGMLRQARERVAGYEGVRFCVGDAEQLPIASESMALLFSNLAIQWCRSDALFEGFYRILKKEGLLLFSSFGPETLWELKSAWKRVDGHQHVNQFSEIGRLERLVQQAGFKEGSIERVVVKRYYKSVFELMRELKGIGAQTVTEGRANHLTGKGKMLKMVEAYESLREEEGIPATWEIVYGIARK